MFAHLRPTPHDRILVRRAAAIVAAATALVYVLIGLGALRVVRAEVATDLLGFGLLSGGAFALGAILLVRFDDRRLWWAGAVFQVLVLVMYVAVAPERDPPYEVWGLLLKAAQVFLLIALAYLAATSRAGFAERGPAKASTDGERRRRTA